MPTQFPAKELQQYLKSELNDLAKSLGLDTYGTKAQLCARILGISPSGNLPIDALNPIENKKTELYIAINCEDFETVPVMGIYSSHEVAVTQSYDDLKKKYGKDKKYTKKFSDVKTLKDKEDVLDEMGVHISLQKLDQPISTKDLKCPSKK